MEESVKHQQPNRGVGHTQLRKNGKKQGRQPEGDEKVKNQRKEETTRDLENTFRDAEPI
jgi:hypothetical protein